MKRILSIFLSIALISCMFPISASANDTQFVNIEIVHQRGYDTPVRKTLSVIESGKELLFSGEDLAMLGGFQYYVENDNAYFTRGLKTLRVELEKNKLYPLEGITILRAIDFDTKVKKMDQDYYFPGSEMLPWLNVSCFIDNDILNVWTDEVSIWDIISEFTPEDFSFDFTECCRELGVGGKYLKTRAYLQGEKLSGKFYDLIPFADYIEWYDLFEDILQDYSAVEEEMEEVLKKADSAAYFMELVDDDEVIKELPDELRVFSVIVEVLSSEYISQAFDWAMYIKYFNIHNKNILSALLALDGHSYGNEDVNFPEAADIALTMLQENYSDLFAGIEYKIINAIGEITLDKLVGKAEGFCKWALRIVGFAEAIPANWSESVNRVSSYDIIAEFAKDTFYREMIVCDVIQLRGLAYMYLYACEQNWTAMAEFANKKGKTDLGAAYEAKAANAEEWQRKFLSAIDAQQNDSLRYGAAVEDRTLGGLKEEYTTDLQGFFAMIPHLLEENTSESTPGDYKCQHSKAEYEELLGMAESCFGDRTFESLDMIQDLDRCFSGFVSWDYSYEEIEQWYDEKNQMYEIPGDIFRNTMCKHFAFKQINIEDYFTGSPGEDPYAPWYDVENDIYHGWVGGMGDHHEGYKDIKLEVLEFGIVKVIGFWKSDDGRMITSSIIVEESADGDMRLKAYTRDVAESANDNEFINNQNSTVLDTTKGDITLTGTLEYRVEESSSENGYVKEMYILHLDTPIKEMIYYDYDSESNAVAKDIAEMDVLSDLGGVKGQYDGYDLTVTGEISPNYTAYYFTYFSIKGKAFTIH